MVKPGYKQTEVGVIPEDWESLPARKLGVFRGGNGFPLNAQGETGGLLPFFKVSDMNNEGNGIFMTQANHRISEQAQKRLGATIFPTGGIVFAKIGAAIFLERKRILGQPSCIDNNMAAFVLNKDRADVRFVHALLLSKKLGSLVSASALPSLNGKQLGDFLLDIPPLPEQQAIATALSDADELIESLEKLLTKKRQIKQGAMQELLTGKKRLPGYSGEWKVKRLGEIGLFLKGSGVKKDEAQSGPIPCIRYGEIYTRHDDYIKVFYSYISEVVAEQARLLKQGDVLFAGSGETKAEIGKCVAFMGDFEAYAGGDIVILRPEGCDSMYLGFALNTPEINRQKASRGQGDAVVHIGSSSLADISLLLPPLPEQTAIAEVLSDMDAEIEALETKLTKARQVKQGMMQELLTGRIRLV
jgi:type I restriction enzyme S subunit